MVLDMTLRTVSSAPIIDLSDIRHTGGNQHDCEFDEEEFQGLV